MSQKQVSRAETSNYIPQYPWDVITCPYPWCVILAPKSSIVLMVLPCSFCCSYIMVLYLLSISFTIAVVALWQDVNRERTVGIQQSGLRVPDVARRVNVSYTRILRLRHRLRKTGTTRDRPRSGRPPVTLLAQNHNIRILHLRDRRRPVTTAAAETQGVITPEYLLRWCVIVSGDLACVLNTCIEALSWPGPSVPQDSTGWQHALVGVPGIGDKFSSMMRWVPVCLSRGDGRVRVWRRRGERYADCYVAEQDRGGGGSVVVWSGIHSLGRTALVVMNGTLNAQREVDEVIRPKVVPYVPGYWLIFQQDNALPHAAYLTQEFLRANAVPTLPWPVYSPDRYPSSTCWTSLIVA